MFSKLAIYLVAICLCVLMIPIFAGKAQVEHKSKNEESQMESRARMYANEIGAEAELVECDPIDSTTNDTRCTMFPREGKAVTLACANWHSDIFSSGCRLMN